jgi:RNA polymerase sigma factor (sigma-70 family)
MTQDADGMAGLGYLDDETMPDTAAVAPVSSNSPRRARSRRGRQRSARQIDSLLFALGIEHRIRARLHRIVKSHQEVSDLLQDVYLQLLLASDRPSQTIQSTTAYVMTVARNKAFDWLRHKKVTATLCSGVDIDDCDVAAEGMRPDELISSEEELEVLFGAISSLPGRCQEVFVMRKVYGMSHKGIAYQIGIAVHTVEQHMTRAMYLLGQSLERYSPQDTLIYAVRESVTRSKVGRRTPLTSA